MGKPAVSLRNKLIALCAAGLIACGIMPLVSAFAEESSDPVGATYVVAPYEESGEAATPNSILASTLAFDGVSIISADVMLDDDTTGPVIGSFTVNGLTYAINSDGVILVAVSPNSVGASFVLAPYENTADSSDGNAIAIPSSITYAGTTYPVTAVGPYAFYLSGATQVELPASIVSVDDRAFRSSDVEWVNVDTDNPNIASFDGALYSADLTSLLLIPEGRAGAVLLPCETEVAEPSKFSHCSLVEVIDVEEGGAAFASWDGLLYGASGQTLLRVPAGATEITIREGCTTIAAGAMEGCAKLERINAPSTVTSISPNVFESVPTIGLPAMTLQDESVVASLDAERSEASPFRDAGAESASADNPAGVEESPSQLTAMVALSAFDNEFFQVDKFSIVALVPDDANTRAWQDAGLSVETSSTDMDEPLDVDSAPFASMLSSEAYVAGEGHTLYVYFNGGLQIRENTTTNVLCNYTTSPIRLTNVTLVGPASVSGSTTTGSAGTGVLISCDQFKSGWLCDGSGRYYTGNVTYACGYTTNNMRHGIDHCCKMGLGVNPGAISLCLHDYWSITFDGNQGSVFDGTRYVEIFSPTGCRKASSVYAGDSLTIPGAVRPGYLLKGWLLGSTLYQPGDIYTPTQDGAAFQAQWGPADFDVSFDVDSEPNDENYPGNQKPDETINIEDGQVVIENPKRPGYVFQGWVIPDAETGNKEALDQDLVYQGDDGKWYVDASKLPDYATDGKVELTARWTSAISVDVPSAVTFYADVVTQGNESREGAASSAFGQAEVINQSHVDLRVVGLESEAVETTDATLGADSILKKASAATPSTSAQKLLSLYPSTKAWTAEELQDPDAVGGTKAATAVDFDLDDLLLEASFSADDFTIPAGDTLNMGYRLNLTETGQELDYDKLSTLEDGQSAAIANVSYCFATMGINKEREPLWFENLNPAWGQTGSYGLLDIKAAANDLSLHAANPAQSSYYKLYKTLLDNAVTFHMRVDDAYVDLQLIGICQDTKTSGGKAGLTFQTKDIYAANDVTCEAAGGGPFASAMNPTAGTMSGGWAVTELRQVLRTSFYGSLAASLQAEIVPVNKFQQLYGGSTSAYLQKTTGETIWLPSLREVLGASFTLYNEAESLTSVAGYVPFQYQAYAGNNGTIPNAKAIKKYNGKVNSWATRSGARNGVAVYCSVTTAGGNAFAYPTQTLAGVAPAFCL